MKKILLLIILLFVLYMPAYAQNTSKIAIAVIDFKSLGVSASDSIFASEFFRVSLVSSGKFRVVEKANMDKILAEQGFQQTGCTTQECAVQMGKMLNVQNIVTGSFGKFGDMYQIITGLVSVETGEIVFSDSANCKTINEVSSLTNELVNRLSDHLSGKPRMPAKGKLFIITDPPYATIHIDRAETGSSNNFGKFEYKGLSANVKHIVEVSREGYEPEAKEVNVNPGETRTMSFVLKERFVPSSGSVFDKPPAKKEQGSSRRKYGGKSTGLMRLKGGILTPAATSFSSLFGNSIPFGIDGIFKLNDFLSICWKNNFILNFITDTAEKPLQVDSASFYMYSTVLGLQLSYDIKGIAPYVGLGFKLNTMLEHATFSDYSESSESLLFIAYGLELSAGVTVMFSENFGIFAELATASTKTGPAEIDIDGTIITAGIIIRPEAK